MLGACRFTPPSDTSGAFLPMSLEGFVLHADVFPDSFICRYSLPVVLERNNRVASTAFEVISHSGDLLASCAKYSVAWIDMSIASSTTPLGVVFQQVWTPKDIPAEVPARKSKLFYFGKRGDWIDTLSDSADKHILDQAQCDRDGIQSLWPTEKSFFTGVLETIDLAPDSTIILDTTQMDDTPGSSSFAAYWQSTLRLMKALGRSKTRAFQFIVLSTTPVSADPAPPLAVLGAMTQGMLRVFRTEVGLHNALGIELPGDASPDVIMEALKAELNGNSKENMVSYRYSRLPGESAVRLRRFVPGLHPLVEERTEMELRGVVIVVGMGSIGAALGPQMIRAGSSAVVFIGRRPPTDAKIAQQLSMLSDSSDKFAYIQADASDMNALRRVLKNIKATYGVIKSIVHTAAFVVDATIDAVTTDAFDRVLRPKVHAAYNLHLLTVELALPLDSFVLFSSISVPLGNQGQVAYVAANAFLDSLAAYRRAIGLPGVSLQLGPWESELVDNLPASSATHGSVVYTISHKDGLPLILRALSSPVPVQVIAALDPRALSRNPTFATDTLFAALVTGVDAPNHPVRTFSSAEVARSVVSILRDVLELTDSEPLELNESLSACGIDSIAFGQIRATVLKQLGVDLPLVYLSDAFSVNDMIGNLQENIIKFADATPT